MNDPNNLAVFTNAYIEALYFTEAGPDGPLSPDMELSEEAKERISRDCGQFMQWNGVKLGEATARTGYGYAQAGHDFWLTRNGHGAGFWSRKVLDEGYLGARLTDVCKNVGTVEAYEGDDGKIYLV